MCLFLYGEFGSRFQFLVLGNMDTIHMLVKKKKSPNAHVRGILQDPRLGAELLDWKVARLHQMWMLPNHATEQLHRLSHTGKPYEFLSTAGHFG